MLIILHHPGVVNHCENQFSYILSSTASSITLSELNIWVNLDVVVTSNVTSIMLKLSLFLSSVINRDVMWLLMYIFDRDCKLLDNISDSLSPECELAITTDSAHSTFGDDAVLRAN